jgi:hypothetical protein
MARSRILKPEFWSDEKLATVPREARLTFAGLWTCSDDYGVTKGHPAWLKAQIFPYDVELPLTEFRKWLADLERIGVIVPFTADGESFFYIRNFSDHQRVDRPGKLRNPTCPPDILARHSRVCRESIAASSRECSDETETEVETETETTTAASRKVSSPPQQHAEQDKNENPPAHNTGRHQPKPVARVLSPVSKRIDFDYETGRFRHVLSALVAKWQEAYPAVDVLSELHRMEAWALANPVNRKSNWQRFIVNWLTKSQDRARSGGSGKDPPGSEGSLERWLKKHSTTS